MAPRKIRTTAKARINTNKPDNLHVFLEQFDDGVKARVVAMREKLNQLLNDVENGYTMALVKLPKTIRQMPWMEQLPEVANVSREEEAAIVESIVAENNPALIKSVQKAKKKATKSTSEDVNTFGTSRKANATRKPPTTSKRAKPLKARRSSCKPIGTPARKMDYSLMGATPLFTPRFDRRLPKTPAVRNPHHKERVYSFSVNGSPIAAGNNEEIVINVPTGNGESVHILASQMDSVGLSLLDDTALRSIRQLKNRLTALCTE
ncbi:hypothetical protein NQZ68_040236 [Dissostichus eleginoides]|uniref:Borealin n=1 Tax=Dissostichus eleginoides TaxID=100907 RepID=A0AAD9CTN7_DISEL|nr:hypothetical protein NQZ68_040236 [Dissostichus eleginoides]KAK1906716.1 Borealin [Dissostichus eleginoides]